MDLHVGDRIELVEMGLEKDGRPDPCPMEPGATGTVRAIVGMDWYGERSHQISVDWDEHVEPSLALVCPPDRYRIIERRTDGGLMKTFCDKSLRPYDELVATYDDRTLKQHLFEYYPLLTEEQRKRVDYRKWRRAVIAELLKRGLLSKDPGPNNRPT